MHEVPIIQTLLSAALKTADEAGAERIAAVSLVIGESANITSESVLFHFDRLAQGTPAEGATLSIDREPATFVCWDCSGTYQAGDNGNCQNCGSSRIQPAGGTRCYVASIDVAEAEAPCA